MAITAETLPIKSVDELRDDYLRTYRNALIARGITNPNVSAGTEIYQRATALAQQVYVSTSNASTAANAVMPDTAQGDDLIREAALWGLTLRGAGPSAGYVVFASTVAVPSAVPLGAELIDPSGLKHTVTVGGPYSNGDAIPVESVDTGEGTNVDAGVALRWTAPPPFSQPTALVDVGGLTGGVDQEDLEDLRERFLDRLANPPLGANWAALNLVAEESSTAVQKSFCYPACNGPSTVHIAVVRRPTATNKNRDVAAVTVATKVTPAVVGAVFEYAESVVTTVTNFSVDVSIGLSIPAAKTAVPAGEGGGWLDGTPFPIDAVNGFVAVSAVSSSTEIEVSSDVAPVVGSRIAWISPSDWKYRQATVLSFTGVGPYVLTLDTPLVSDSGVVIAINDYVFPACEQGATYTAQLLEGFARLGPGQKTDIASLLPRALRRPTVTQSWPSDINRKLLKVFTGTEVDGADFLYRSATSPSVPGSITDPPKIYVPRNLAFYPLE